MPTIIPRNQPHTDVSSATIITIIISILSFFTILYLGVLLIRFCGERGNIKERNGEQGQTRLGVGGSGELDIKKQPEK